MKTITKVLDAKSVVPMELLIDMIENHDGMSECFKKLDEIPNIEMVNDQRRFNGGADDLVPIGMCSICFVNKVIVCCIPCGHVATCQSCWDLWENKAKCCTICSKPVTQTMHAYFPTI